MSWFWDLLVDTGHTLITDYREGILIFLAWLILKLFKSRIDDVRDQLEANAKDNAMRIVFTIIAVILFLTMDDPLFSLSKIKQFMIGFGIIIIFYFYQIKTGVEYTYDKFVQDSEN